MPGETPCSPEGGMAGPAQKRLSAAASPWEAGRAERERGKGSAGGGSAGRAGTGRAGAGAHLFAGGGRALLPQAAPVEQVARLQVEDAGLSQQGAGAAALGPHAARRAPAARRLSDRQLLREGWARAGGGGGSLLGCKTRGQAAVRAVLVGGDD